VSLVHHVSFVFFIVVLIVGLSIATQYGGSTSAFHDFGECCQLGVLGRFVKLDMFEQAVIHLEEWPSNFV